MPATDHEILDYAFHPRSIALVGITLSNPGHWTHVFLNSLVEFGFQGHLYPVNPKGGEIKGLTVYRSISEIPGSVDYAISTVSAVASPQVVEECATKDVKIIHMCTAGFSETGEPEGKRLETEVARVARARNVRIIGPNCMGIYCPKSNISFDTRFPKEPGKVAFVSQSGGNCLNLIMETILRGIRFSKVISYGNACDFNESDFLEYLADDADTEVVAIYVEGVKNGQRLCQALAKVAAHKPVILLKGGVSESGNRAAAGHTGALAGNEAVWNAACRQHGAIRVLSMEQLGDMLVTFSFLPVPKGKNVALIGHGGGASVLIADEFERHGLVIPPLPQELKDNLVGYTPLAGNILRNPIDYGQSMVDIDKLVRTCSLISNWPIIDIVAAFLRPSGGTAAQRARFLPILDGIIEGTRSSGKPLCLVLQQSVAPDSIQAFSSVTEKYASSGLPIYFSFDSAARAISTFLNYEKHRRNGGSSISCPNSPGYSIGTE